MHLGSDEAFAAYWNRPDADASAIREGWYRTGDTGHLDEDGDLWLDGRVDDMIVSGSENIHPLEVEDVLAAHPHVDEVAVVGVPDERLGQRVVAVVVGTATREELDAPASARRSRASSAPASTGTATASEERIGEDPATGAARRGERVTDHDGFRIEREGAVATITLDVPGKFNRVSMQARDQLSAAFADLDADDEVRLVVLTGAGGNFSAGGDIAGFLERSPWVVSQLARNVAAPSAARSRSSRGSRGTCSGSASSSRSPATSASLPTTCSSASPR